jgi:nuclear protein localization family protein 4
VDSVAKRLGLERLGLIFTVPVRDFILSAAEAVAAAERQLTFSTDEHYTGYRLSKFVTCIVSPDPKGGQPEISALMVSDQSMGMVRDRLVTLATQDLEKPKLVRLRQPEKTELLPTVLQSGKEVTEFDPDWFIVRVNHGVPLKPRGFFAHAHFPRENRENEKQLMSSLKFYKEQLPSQEPSWKRFADFHLILFLAKALDIDTAFAVCDALRDKRELGADLEELIQAISTSS